MVSSADRLAHVHRLEAPLECGILLDVLAILVERRRADGMQLTASERGLEHVGCVHGSLGRTSTHERVQLVDEEDQLPLGLLDLTQHRLETVLELAAVLRSGDHRAEVERDDVLVAQARRDITLDDALRKSLDDGGLARAGLADEHRVVLRAPREDLDDAADLIVAADDRVELALASHLREVRLKRSSAWNCASGFWSVTVAPARSSSRAPENPVARYASVLQDPPGLAGLLRECHQQVLGRDVGVLELLGHLEGLGKHAVEPRPDACLREPLTGHRRGVLDGRGDPRLERVGVGTDLLDDRAHDALGLIEQRLEQVLRLDDLRGRLVCDPLGRLQRLLRLDRQFVESHICLLQRRSCRVFVSVVRPLGRRWPHSAAGASPVLLLAA